MEPLRFGDWVFIQRSREDTGLPGDIVERVGQVVGVKEAGVWLAFPYGWAVKGSPRGEPDVPGSPLSHDPLFVKYEARGKPYQLRRVELLEPYRAGFVGRMVPVDLLMARNDWRYGKCLALCEGKWESLWADIQESGMRHPPMVSKDLAIHAGLSRIYAHYKAGEQLVECFIYDQAVF